MIPLAVPTKAEKKAMWDAYRASSGHYTFSLQSITVYAPDPLREKKVVCYFYKKLTDVMCSNGGQVVISW